MEKIGFDLNDTLLSCYFDNNECDSTFFTKFTSFDQGNCWTFNPVSYASVLYTSQTGKYFGLTVELFTGFDGIIAFKIDN